ncbi:MAG: NADPH-dependent FMN reductase, partial [Betaproteobacteria bacterium]
MTKVRKGEAPPPASRREFHQRFLNSYVDPAFAPEAEAIERIEKIAWHAYTEGRKAPVTRKAGDEFADPDYDLSVEWLATRDALLKAEAVQKSPKTRSRILIISGSSRNDGTCPGEISKSFRMAELAKAVVKKARFDADYLDL